MANLFSPATISLLILMTFSYDALSNDEDLQLDAVCYYFCDNSTSNISEVYLNKQQIQHLKGCKQFINALEDTPEMMNTYEDLRAMEMVKFTDEQVKQLLVGNRGYFHQRSHLPREQQINDIKPESNYSSDELQALEEEFMERWLAYREIEDSLKSFTVHFPLGESSSSSSQSSSPSSQSSSPGSESRRRRRRWVKSYRPHQSRPGMERKLVRNKGGMASQDPKKNLTRRTKDFFRSTVGRRRTNPFLHKESSSIKYDESSDDSFQERLYQRYLQAIETSVEKMTEMSRNRRNVDRQKREDPKPAESLELCPTSKFWTAMVLGYDESGNLVQVTQVRETLFFGGGG